MQKLKGVSLAAIAENMGQSRAWLSQRINGHEVNGKPAKFTDKELKRFIEVAKEMCGDFINELQDFANDYE